MVATFRHAVSTESAECYAAAAGGPTPLDRLRTLLASLIGHERDGVSLLWLDAWSAFRHRAGLAAEVNRQMAVDKQRLGDLIADGVAEGQFHSADPTASAAQIYAVIDGLAVLAAVGPDVDYTAVRDLVFTNAERELRVAAGELHPQPDADPVEGGQSVVGPAKAASLRVKP